MERERDTDLSGQVSKSRLAQGLPSKIVDKAVIAQLANIVIAAKRFRHRRD